MSKNKLLPFSKAQTLEHINKVHEKAEQLKKVLPMQIYSSNRIQPELLSVETSLNGKFITIRLKGLVTTEVLNTIESDGFDIRSIAARRSEIIILVGEMTNTKN